MVDVCVLDVVVVNVPAVISVSHCARPCSELTGSMAAPVGLRRRVHSCSCSLCFERKRVNAHPTLRPPSSTRPPPSPPVSVASLHASGSAPSTPSASQPRALVKETSSLTEAVSTERSAADEVADRVIDELFAPSSGLERGKTFRTEYRAVVSEVIGLAVKW